MRQQWEKQGVGNLEAVELGLRQAILKDGCRLLEQLLESLDASLPNGTRQEGEKCHAHRPRHVETIFGTLHLKRDYFYSPATGQGRVPLDQALGLIHSHSPGLVRLASRAAAREGYEAASDDLNALAGIRIEGRQIQRLVNQIGPQVAAQLKEHSPAIKEDAEPIAVAYTEVDGTGVPMVPQELVGRKGKQSDGSAKTREVKLGCVFTQTKTDEKGQPMRDYQSTSYVGSFESAEEFGAQIRAEAQRRGISRAKKLVFIGDGAAWVWELARVNFPLAILILDFFHMMEYLHALCQELYGKESSWAQRMKEQWRQMLEDDQVDEVIAAMQRRLKDLGQISPEKLESVTKQIAYLENNRERMKYGTYRKQGLFYGSGVVEAGCKTVIGKRLKQSGMLWTRVGADNVLALRCALMSNRWDECWNRINHSDYLKPPIAA